MLFRSKGGVAYLLETQYGIDLPKEMQREFGPIANDEVDRLGREVSGAQLKAMFWREYIERNRPWELESFHTENVNGKVRCNATIRHLGTPRQVQGEGNGPIAAFVNGLTRSGIPKFEVIGYSEHALSSGEEAAAIAYIQARSGDGTTRWGAGVDTNIEIASIRAILSALNRL